LVEVNTITSNFTNGYILFLILIKCQAAFFSLFPTLRKREILKSTFLISFERIVGQTDIGTHFANIEADNKFNFYFLG